MTQSHDVDEVIADLTSKLDQRIWPYVESDSGWHDIIARAHLDLMKLDPDYRPVQVKEKFGLLRFYADFSKGREAAGYERIREAEKESEDTCEMCGAKDATLRTSRRWIKTLCDKCDDVVAQQYAETKIWQDAMRAKRQAK